MSVPTRDGQEMACSIRSTQFPRLELNLGGGFGRTASRALLLLLTQCSPKINSAAVPPPSEVARLGAEPTTTGSNAQPKALALTVLPPTASSTPSQDREPSGQVRHVIVVTIDGLLPEVYTNPAAHGLQVPTLQRLRREGASSDGALSVWPSLTYPAHTSIATGTRPGTHGVVSNSAFDPLGENQDGWRWYASDVKVPRIWDVARDAGYRTALIDWPATVGAEATLHVPEFWRARIDEDLKLIGALSTPKDILQRVAREYPNFARGFRPQNVSDEAGFDLASYALRHVRPHLMFLHVWEVDHAQHVHGLWSKEAAVAIENADHQLGRLLDLVRELGLTEQTALVLASDHGFTNISRSFNPQALLKKAGLLSVDEHGKITGWDAIAMPTHGSAYVYLRNDADVGVRTATLRVFQQAQRAYPDAIASILSHEQVVAAGGDGSAFLALAAPLGTSFGSGVQHWQSKPTLKATHGYDPEQPAMRASLLLFGAGVASGRLQDARLIDVAPTVATWLGLQLPSAEGRLLQAAP